MAGDSNKIEQDGFTHCSSNFCPDPTSGDIYDPDQVVTSIGRAYYCTKGTSDITVSWSISVPNTFVASISATQKSIGKIYIKTSSNVNILSNTAIIPSIVYVGVDPNCSVHNVYNVSYSFTDIPQTTFDQNPGYKIVTQVLLYYGCNNNISFYSSPAATYSSISTYGGVVTDGSGGILSACYRTDRCYTSIPSTSIPYSQVFGGYTLCTYLPAYPTDKQRYEYRKKTSTTSNAWSAQTSVPEWALDPNTNVPTHDLSPYTGVLKMPDMITGSGTWIVRYQNVMNTPCSPDALWKEEVYTF